MGVLRFGLFGFQIHIQPSFWLIALLLASSAGRSVANHLILVAVVFLSLLTHELGHAIAARRAGLNPVIVIHAFGGITRWLPIDPLPRGRAIAIAMAGPAAGLLIATGAVLAVKQIPGAASGAIGQLRHGLVLLAQVSGFWSLLNLLPIMPFDGGTVLAHLLGPKRRGIAAQISLAVGVLAALVLFRLGLKIAAVVFLLAAVVQFIVSLRAATRSVAVDTVRLELLLGQARRALEEGDNEAAEKAAESAIRFAADPLLRQRAAEIYAWAALGRQQPEKARRVLEFLVGTSVDPLLRAAMLESEGDVDRAITCLRQARVAGDDRPQLAASLVRLLLAADRYGEAALTTIQILDHVTEQEARKVAAACRDGARPIPAAELSMALFARSGDLGDLAWALVCFSTSGNREAVSKLLALAADLRVVPSQLFASAAFESIAPDGELRRIVGQALSVAQPVSTT